jgi:putative selenium metabolism hydrolase
MDGRRGVLMDPARLLAFTQELLRTRSMSGEEGLVVAQAAAEMQALGYDQVEIDAYGSAVGVIAGARPGPTLLLDGHLDIVEAYAADWSHPPFAAEIADGYLYGRGVADMKGAVAAMIHAAASVDRSRLVGRVAVSASVLEEVMEGAALKLIMDRLQPDAVIIGEATDFNVQRGGRGRAEIVIETVGKSAHASSPQAGLCAVHEMIRLMAALEALPMPHDPVIGTGLLCLTDIISEPYPGHSMVPNRCRATYDRRLVPGETPAGLLAAIRALPELADIAYTVTVLEGEEPTYTGVRVPGQKFYPAWSFPEAHPLVQAALRGLRRAGFEPQVGAFGFCTNAAYSAGIAGVPTIGFGPGVETDAHVVDERLAIRDLRRAAEGYQAIIQAFLS